MNNNAKKKFYEIVWIVIQVGLTFFLSECCNLKNWSVNSKLTYILTLLVITVYTWFFDLKDIKKIKNIKNIISKIYNFLVVVWVLVWLLVSFKRKKRKKISNDSDEAWIVISNVLKMLYISIVVILIRSLWIGEDTRFEKKFLKLVLLYIFIFLCVTIVSIFIKELKESTRYIITIFIVVIIIFLQSVKFKEVFVALILTIIIPIVNWYSSKERVRFFNETQEISLEEEKRWAIYKVHTLMFSMAIGFVLIVKDTCGEEIIGKLNSKSIIVTNLFEVENQGVHPNMVMGWAVMLVYGALLLLLKCYRKISE
ncbi:hypothetical protein O3797_04870 [Gemella sanguinis]|uniref:hypothetical protein n=1 Tax=Gemella sanguinis TaxID=84135 RepID=UPI00352F384F